MQNNGKSCSQVTVPITSRPEAATLCTCTGVHCCLVALNVQLQLFMLHPATGTQISWAIYRLDATAQVHQQGKTTIAAPNHTTPSSKKVRN